VPEREQLARDLELELRAAPTSSGLDWLTELALDTTRPP